MRHRIQLTSVSFTSMALGMAACAAILFAASPSAAQQDPNRDTSGVSLLELQGGYMGYGPMDDARAKPSQPKPVGSQYTRVRATAPAKPVAQPRSTSSSAQQQPAPTQMARAPLNLEPPPARHMNPGIATPQDEDLAPGQTRVAGPGPAIAKPPKQYERAEPQMHHAGIPPEDFPEGILIDHSDRTLYYIRDGAIVRTFAVGIPRRNATRIFGDTTITRKRPNPTWRPTPRMIKEDPSLPEVVGPGPSNPLGTRAMNTGWQYIAIHGTSRPGSIGGEVSSGCYRLYNDDVEWLYDEVELGLPVRVRR